MLAVALLTLITAVATTVAARREPRRVSSIIAAATLAAGYILTGLFLIAAARGPVFYYLGICFVVFASAAAWFRRAKDVWSGAALALLPLAAVAVGYVAVGPLPSADRLAAFFAWANARFAGLALDEGAAAFALLAVAALLYLSAPANAAIKPLLRRLGVPRDPSEEEYRRGAVIGTLERWITFGLILGGQYTALAFIIAAKSIVRHKKMDDVPGFAEYFLIGTLTSIGLALAAGLVLAGLRAVIYTV